MRPLQYITQPWVFKTARSAIVNNNKFNPDKCLRYSRASSCQDCFSAG